MESNIKKEFQTLMLIYAAHSDLEFHDKEIQYIEQRFGKDTFEKMNQFFANHTDYEILSWLRKHKDCCIQSEKDKEEIIRSIKEIFDADEKLDLLERNFLMLFERLLLNA